MKRVECFVRGLWFMILLAAVLPANASVKIVGNVTDYVTITNAIASAGINDVIRVSTGTYVEVFNIYNKPNLTIDGGYNYDCTVKLANTTSSLRAVGPIYGMVIDIENSTVQLNDLDIRGGQSFGSYALHGAGVHIRNNSQVQIARCRVWENYASGYGGGIYASNSTLVVTNSIIYSNRAVKAVSGAYLPDGRGGGIAAVNAVVTLDNSVVRWNEAGYKGGGIYAGGSSRCVLTNGNTEVRFNTATNGGGIAVADGSRLEVLAGTDICGNQAYAHGGGILLRNNSTGIIQNTGTYIGYNAFNMGPNIAGLNGGGIAAENSRVEISQAARVAHNKGQMGGGIALSNAVCVISNASVGFVSGSMHTNEAMIGGGIALRTHSHLILTNGAVIHGNRSSSAGGGIYAISECVVAMHDSVVRYNTAQSFGGGGFYINLSTITGRNSAIYNNAVQDGSDGGGIRSYQCSGFFDSTSISTNTASGNGGGISWVGGPGYALRMVGNSQIWDNDAGNNGGGMVLEAPGDLTSTYFSGNSASNHGGGLYISNTVVSLNDVSLEYNLADNGFDGTGDGGGLWVGGRSTVSVHTALAGFALVGGNRAQKGGGLYAEENSRITIAEHIANLEFYNNSARQDGGGIALYDSSLTMTGGVLFVMNSARQKGGAVYATRSRALISGGVSFGDADTNNANWAETIGGGLAAAYSTVLLSQVSFVNNWASNYSGGVDFLRSQVSGTNLNVVGNRALTGDGGGMTVGGWSSAYLYGTGGYIRVSENSARRGGGIAVSDGSLVMNGQVRVEGNQGSGDGGGMYASGSSTAGVVNAYFLRNVAASNGGGIYMGSNTYVALRNCLLAENRIPSVSYYGGGLQNAKGNALFVSCTVASNAISGVEASAGSQLTIAGCIVFGHPIANVTVGYNVDYSCIQNGYATGTGNFTNYPLWYPANYHLTAWSPCRNTGWPAMSETDVDGEPRSGNVDAGFDEFVDADSDYLPDIVETHTGTWAGETDTGTDPANADSDGDGLPDGEEWLADTDPNVPSSALKFVSAYGGENACFLSWTGGVNSIQYLEYCTNFMVSSGNPNWELHTQVNPPTPSPGGASLLGSPTNLVFRLRARRPGY